MTGSDKTGSIAFVNSAQRVRFGVFEADLRNRELRKHGFRVKLQKKPFQILELLLQRPAELVSREELAEHLWPGVYVSFERSLNTAVNALRRALCDSPRNSRYIETRAGLGYVFVAPLALIDEGAGHAASSGDNSVAVLPFESIGGDGDGDPLCDSIAESVLATLSNVPELRVVARSASFRFRGAGTDACAAGRRLGARKVLTGSIGRSGGALRVHTELVDVGTGCRLWGQRYERPASEAAAVADGIAAGVLSTFHVRPEAAYEDYLKGRHFCTRTTEDDLHRAVAHFEAALAQHPRFALASAGLADALGLSALLGVRPATEVYARAKQLATTALEHEPHLAEAHASLARIRAVFEWDWDAAEAGFLRAIELNPFSATVRQAYAGHLAATGRFDAALSEIGQARQLDPMALVINADMARILYMARDFKAAAEQSWQALALDARFAPAQHTLGLAYEQMGMIEEAVVEFGNAATCSNQHPATLAALAHAHAAAGDLVESRRMLGVLEDAAKRRYVSPWWLSIVHTGLDEPDLAFKDLRKSREDRDVWLVWLAVEPRLDRLRSDARFAELLRGIGLGALTAAAES